MPYQKKTAKEKRVKKLRNQLKRLHAKQQKLENKIIKIFLKSEIHKSLKADQDEMRALRAVNTNKKRIQKLEQNIFDLEYLIDKERKEKDEL